MVFLCSRTRKENVMLIIKNALVYAPEKLGKKDLLIAGERIVAIEDHIDAAGLPGR